MQQEMIQRWRWCKQELKYLQSSSQNHHTQASTFPVKISLDFNNATNLTILWTKDVAQTTKLQG